MEDRYDLTDILNQTFSFSVYEEPLFSATDVGQEYSDDCSKHKMKQIQICADTSCPSRGTMGNNNDHQIEDCARNA